MQVEVASYLFLVGLFGLKAPPAYILAACNHRIFQSDNCKVSCTIFEKALERVSFCFIRAESPKVRLFCSQKQYFPSIIRLLITSIELLN